MRLQNPTLVLSAHFREQALAAELIAKTMADCGYESAAQGWWYLAEVRWTQAARAGDTEAADFAAVAAFMAGGL